MTDEIVPGMGAKSPETYEAPDATGLEAETTSSDPLAPGPGEETADAILIYPRDRYLAARRGDTPREAFAADLVRHVRAQAPRRYLSAAAAAALRHT